MCVYGRNPYAGYDSSARPFLYGGEMPPGVAPLSRVVSLEARAKAWSLDLVTRKGEIMLEDGIVIGWSPGQNSALGAAMIAEGADVGNILFRRKTDDGWEDVTYFVDFAVTFHPDAPIDGK